MAPALRIVICNWNSGPQLRQCLHSIAAHPGSGFRLAEVVVVDNASADDSATGLDGIDLPLRVLRQARNCGFAVACNAGAAGATADYLLFLNPDTRLFEGSLALPVAFLERPENAAVGICGVQMRDEQARVARSCARFPRPLHYVAQALALDRLAPAWCRPHFMSEWDHLDTREVDQVIGAFFMVRRSLFEQLGGFDPRFFVYMEEVDFSLRARAAGWRTMFLAEAAIFHRGGGTTSQVKAARLFYSLRSRIQYAYKHFGAGPASLVLTATVLLEPVSRLAWAVLRASAAQAGDTLRAFLRLYGWLGAAPLRYWRRRAQQAS